MLAAAAAITAGRAAEAAEKLTFITGFGYVLGFIEVMYGEAAGIFGREGLDLAVQGGNGTAMALQQVLSGNAQIARAGSIDVIRAVAARNAPLVAFGTSHRSGTYHVISDPGSPIRDPAGLRGKTIGIASRGGSTDDIVSMMLAAGNVDSGDVRREVVGADAAAFGLVRQKRIDAFMGTVSTLLQLHQRGIEVAHWSTDDWAPNPNVVYLATTRTASDRPDALSSFLRGARASVLELASADPTHSLEVIATHFDPPELKRPDTAPDIARLATDIMVPAAQGNFASTQADWDKAAALMRKAGLIETPDHPFFTDAIVRRAFG